MAGRPPKPDHIKAKAGNPGKRKPKVVQPVAAPTDPEPPVDEFAPPADLTDAERIVWLAELPRLRKAGLLKLSDLSAFRIYVEAMVRKGRAKSVVDAQGLTYQTETGYVRERPEVKILERAERVIKDFMKELALTTKSRVQTAATMASRQYSLPLDPSPAAPSSAAAPSTGKAPPPNGGPIGALRRHLQ